MSLMKTTITIQDQITLPAHPLAPLRAQAQAEMEAAGTWGHAIDTTNAWGNAAAEKLSNASGSSRPSDHGQNA